MYVLDTRAMFSQIINVTGERATNHFAFYNNIYNSRSLHKVIWNNAALGIIKRKYNLNI